jgi:hypothetical protein
LSSFEKFAKHEAGQRLDVREGETSSMLEEWYRFLDMDRMFLSMPNHPGPEGETQDYQRS